MQRKSFGMLFVSGLVAFTFSFSPKVNAAAQRTFVASYGSSTNSAFNCSITKPCRAFSDAIGVTNSGGEVIVLDSAGYGPVSIAQSVSIVAPAGVYAGISVPSGNDGVTISAPAGQILLHGLSINGQGGSIGMNIGSGGARVRIENCVIAGMASHGIFHHAPGSRLTVVDSSVHDNGGDGINSADDGVTLVLDRVRVQHNALNGVSMAPTGSFPQLTVTESNLTGNGMNGIIATAANPNTTLMLIQVDRTTLSDNGGAGFKAAVASQPLIRIDAMLSRNGFKGNVLAGIVLQAPGAGRLAANVVENFIETVVPTLGDIGTGIHIDGGSVSAILSSNSVGPLASEVVCSNHAEIHTFGNNNIYNPFHNDGTCTVASDALK